MLLEGFGFSCGDNLSIGESVKIRVLSALLLTGIFLSHPTRGDDDLGPAVYLAGLHEVSGKTLLHWKYNIAKPEVAEVRVVDSTGQEVCRVSRSIRQADVTGRTGPFRLVPVMTGREAGEGITVSVEEPWKPADSFSRIGIGQRGGCAEFVELATGKVFHPVGMNYVPLRFGDHAAFEAATTVGEGFYDALETESVMRLLRKNGYNTVRVFLAGRRPKNPGLSGEADTEGLYTPYLDNLADFLARASSNGIHVIFNFCDVDLPQNRYFREKLGGKDGTENLFLSSGVLAFREMVASTLDYLKAKNPDLLKAILGVQFNNEICAKLTRWPFSESGPVSTANGKTYDMSVPEDRSRCFEEGLGYFYKQVCAAVKEVDSGLLTCEGTFVAAAVGRDHRTGAAAFDPANLAKGFGWEKDCGLRVPPALPVFAESPLDFVDVHLYPAGKLDGFEQSVENLLESSRFRDAVAAGLCSKKPVILGECGAFKAHVKRDTGDGTAGAMQRWSEIRRLACGKYGFTGYLGWSLETFEQTGIFQALAFAPGFLRSFREEFNWPETGADDPPNSDAAAGLPLLLKDEPPNGQANGYFVPQTLSP